VKERSVHDPRGEGRKEEKVWGHISYHYFLIGKGEGKLGGKELEEPILSRRRVGGSGGEKRKGRKKRKERRKNRFSPRSNKPKRRKKENLFPYKKEQRTISLRARENKRTEREGKKATQKKSSPPHLIRYHKIGEGYEERKEGEKSFLPSFSLFLTFF